MEKYDVIIVGLGPVGALAANLLGKYKIKTLILEKEPVITSFPRAIHLDGAALRILQACGYDDIAAHMLSISGVKLWSKKKQNLISLQAPQEFWIHGRSPSNTFYQPILEKTMRQSLMNNPDITCRLNSTLTKLDQENSGVKIQFKTQNTSFISFASANYLIACDGGKSTVRRLLNIPIKNFKFDQKWLVVDAVEKTSINLPSYVIQWCNPQRPSSFIPGMEKHKRWEFLLNKQDKVDSTFIRQLLSTWIDPKKISITRYSEYIFHGLIAQEWQINNIFLAGDAAHQMPPFLGQGLCSGFQDIFNLIWKIHMVITKKASSTLLSSYYSERYPQVKRLIRMSILLGKWVQTQQPVIAFFRNIFLRIINHMPFIKRKLEKTISYPLGKGFFKSNRQIVRNSFYHSWFPQLKGIDSNGRDRWLDHYLGKGFSIISFSEDPYCLLHESTDFWKSLDTSFVWIKPLKSYDLSLKQTGKTSHMLLISSFYQTQKHFKADIFLLRPDRHIFGYYHSNRIPSKYPLDHMAKMIQYQLNH